MTATRPEVNPTTRYSLTDAAMQLGVSKRTVERWLEENKLKAVILKINNRRYITGTEILRVWNASY